MSRLARLPSWVRSMFGRDDLERRMRLEMEAHLDLFESDLRRRGLSDEEARHRARAEFGSVAARQDECREAFGLRLLHELRGDVTYALRLLRRSPAFTVVALLSIGLGIGANTAIFSLVDTVLLKSLPVADPQRLFFIDNTGGRSGGGDGPPYPCFEVLRDGNRFFSGMAAFSAGPFKVSIDGGAPERVPGQHASGNYFEVLGIRAVHGRVLTPADDSVFDRGGPEGAVAVISYGFWNRRFARDPAVVGKSIQIGSRWVTIVGVTEAEFFGLQTGSPIDITTPMMLAGDDVRSKTTWWMSVVGRLEADASVEQARADVEALWDGYMTDIGQPPEKRGRIFTGIALVPAMKGLNALRRSFSEPLLIVMAIVGVVLLIGCANVANLLLARASARHHEMSVRLAMGAGRSRLVRQLLTEGAVLVALGSAGGLLFARWGASFIASLFGRGGQGVLLNPAFDLRVLAFTAAVAAFTALLFSLAPALHATRSGAAKPAATTTSPAGSRARLGQSLVAIQVMLSVVLTCGAALFLRTLHNLNALDSGYDREGVLTTVVEASVPGRAVPPATPGEQRRDHARLGAMWESLAARLMGMPGVTSAAVSTMSPLTGRDRGVGIAVEGAQPGLSDGRTHLNQVTAGYFETMGIRVVSGRALTPQDRAASPRVVVLNETAAQAFFAGENPISRRLNFPKQRIEDYYEIVGVVRDARYRSLREPDQRMVYIPLDQAIDPITMAAVAVRGPGDAMSLAPALRTAVADTIPGGFVTRLATIEERVKESLVRERLLSMLATFFGGLALALACIGLYGVMSYAVVRRTREIGIRIAIGARQRSVVWMVVRETLALVGVGAVLGAVAAAAAGRYVKSQLFGVAPGDPVAISAAVLLLLAVTVAAGYLPARRASRIDPMKALRCE